MIVFSIEVVLEKKKQDFESFREGCFHHRVMIATDFINSLTRNARLSTSDQNNFTETFFIIIAIKECLNYIRTSFAF